MEKSNTEDWGFGNLEDIAALRRAEDPARHLIPEAAVKNVCLSIGIRWSQNFRNWYELSASILASDIIEEVRAKIDTKRKIEILSQAALDPAKIIQDYVTDKLHESEWLYGDKWQASFIGLRSILAEFYGSELNQSISLQDTERLLRACRSHFTALSQAEIKSAAKRGRRKSQSLARAMNQVCRMADLYGLKLTLPANEAADIKEAYTPLFLLALSLIGHSFFKLSMVMDSKNLKRSATFAAIQSKSEWLNHLSPRTLLTYLREEVRLVQAQNSVIRAHQLPPHGASEIRAFNPSDGIPSEEIQSCSKPEPSGSTRSPNTPR